MAQKIRPENIVRTPRRFGILTPEYWKEHSEPGTPDPSNTTSSWSGDGRAIKPKPPARRRGGDDDTEDSSLQAAVKSVDATCPLAGFDADAVQWSIPPVLLELGGKYAKRKNGGGRSTNNGGFNPTRIWATALSVASLSRLDESWLVSGEGEADETIVDRAWGYLNLQAAAFPELGRCLIPVMEEAQRLVGDSWEPVHEIAIRNARDEQMRAQALHFASQLTRASGHMVTMAVLKHKTVACFTAPATDGVLRHQRVFVYLTAIMVRAGERLRA